MIGFGPLSTVELILQIPVLVRGFLFLLVGLAGVVGAAMAATTRDDAYDAADRKSKWVWVGILAGSSVVCLLQMPFIAWFGAVAIGVYYFDVRPQLNNILRGNYGW
ncbi:DUF2516 family protein [Corynebacterium auris]|uniref:DUF2516 family protein n=1 Tax=Corynebacterium auris TaxID=44750 RepID=UPI003F495FE2|nr:hypothetical protein CAURIS_01355 [Corynebacterium auris]